MVAIVKSIYGRKGQPYLCSIGMEDGINYIFTMTPLMSDILAVADFIEADITYDENTEYCYLLNVAAFNEVLMQWMVVARICLDKENSEAYRIAFQKVFSTCTSKCLSFSPTNSLKGIDIDWSKAKMNGIKLAMERRLQRDTLGMPCTLDKILPKSIGACI